MAFPLCLRSRLRSHASSSSSSSRSGSIHGSPTVRLLSSPPSATSSSSLSSSSSSSSSPASSSSSSASSSPHIHTPSHQHSSPLITFDDVLLHKITQRIASFSGKPIPLLPPSRPLSNVSSSSSSSPSSSSTHDDNLTGTTAPIRHAAVLIPLCNAHGQASILYQIRTSTVRTHKGQVSFPGGHLNPNESPMQAALREFHEEMGSSSSSSNSRDGGGFGPMTILTACQPLPAVTGTVVHPFLAFLHRDVGDFSCFSPCNGEVASLFCLSLPQLLDPTLAGREDLPDTKEGGGRRRLNMPFFNGGPAKVWGLTAFITDGVLARVLRPCLEGGGEGGKEE